jgi:hypothetical protein
MRWDRMARMRLWIRWEVVVRGRRVRVGKWERMEIRIWGLIYYQPVDPRERLGKKVPRWVAS